MNINYKRLYDIEKRATISTSKLDRSNSHSSYCFSNHFPSLIEWIKKGLDHIQIQMISWYTSDCWSTTETGSKVYIREIAFQTLHQSPQDLSKVPNRAFCLRELAVESTSGGLDPLVDLVRSTACQLQVLPQRLRMKAFLAMFARPMMGFLLYSIRCNCCP